MYIRRINFLVAKGGGLLIGVDLKKDAAILEATYNDAQGVTAEFNLNILAYINRSLGADFGLGNFAHRAFYHAEKGRIEMHLVSLLQQEVRIGGRIYAFKAAETVHTENSYKYSIEEFHQLAEQTGLIQIKVWVDSKKLFSVHFLVGP